jgi:hypothetical protein
MDPQTHQALEVVNDYLTQLFDKVAALEAKVEKFTSTNKPMVVEAAQISPCQHEWIQACTQMICRKCRVLTDD